MNFQNIKPKIIKLAQNNPEVELLWVYGSQANGTANKHSDLEFSEEGHNALFSLYP